MPESISIDDFVTSKDIVKPDIIDARSPREFEKGHIPGALNLPLLNNEERAVVGTLYKQKGHDAAVLKGFDLVGSKFGDYIRKANEICGSRDVILYCWRGGMRSSIMGWLLDKGRFNATLLKGGYKSYRRWALNELESDRDVVVMGGMTGSGKTDLLKELAKQGEQVIDLESLAHHKGSAFGSLGQEPQPTNEQFENELAFQWHSLDGDKITWIENESSTIGTVILPASIYRLIRSAPMIEVTLNRKRRVERILNEYGSFPKDVLADTTKKLKKRLGGQHLNTALKHLDAGEMKEWVSILLDYYDKAYYYGTLQREGPVIGTDELDLDDMNTDALKIQALRKANIANFD